MTLLSKRLGRSPSVRYVSGEDRRTTKAARTSRKARPTKTKTHMSDQEKTKRKRKLKAKSTKIVTHEMLKQIVTNSEGDKPQPDTTLGNSVHNAIPTDGHGTEPPQDILSGV